MQCKWISNVKASFKLNPDKKNHKMLRSVASPSQVATELGPAQLSLASAKVYRVVAPMPVCVFVEQTNVFT